MISDVAGITHIGLVRKENQDGFLVETFGSKPEDSFTCLAVADGMGGHEKGRLASEQAIITLRADLASGATETHPIVPSLQLCSNLALSAHREVGKIAESGETVGTTLTVLLVQGDNCYIGQVGDSRAYRYREGELLQLTEDQVWDAQSDFPLQLRQAVGVSESIEPDTRVASLQNGDWLLVCSDGLHKFVPHDSILETFIRAKTATKVCERLLELALKAGGRDNVAICVGKAGAEPSADEGAGWPASNWKILAFVAIVVLGLAILTYLSLSHNG